MLLYIFGSLQCAIFCTEVWERDQLTIGLMLCDGGVKYCVQTDLLSCLFAVVS